MSRIHILDPRVAAQIAAGEVITRPAAVVKELVENALDAGARTIGVDIEEGGRRRIRVVDDGCGMSREELPLSLKRHATSKLAAEPDLLAISTLGFRGEALPSIATVSRLTLISCQSGADAAWRLTARAGEIKESSPCAAPGGTQVEVLELFFNTPARRKFLKSKEAEQGHILESMRHLALGYPAIHFALRTPARILLAAPATGHLAERVAALYGAEVASHMLPLALAYGDWQVTGLITDPDFSLATTRFQVFLVNGRAVQDRVLGAALKEVYSGLLPRGRHPAAVVALQLPPGEVDVNVHPAKTEIRFQDPGKVYTLLVQAMRQSLGPLQGVSPQYTVGWRPEPWPRAAEPALATALPSGLPPPAGGEPDISSWLPQGEAVPVLRPGPPVGPARFRFQDLVVLGQLKQTYILAQGPEGLILIDQHAAHERVLYETLKAGNPLAASQALLFPRVVEVNPSQVDWVRANLEVLAEAGLILEPFGGSSFLLTAAPAFLSQADLEAVVVEAVDSLSPQKSLSQPQAVREQALLFMACRGAIKAGETLPPEAVQALLTQLDEISVSSHCPHGRPLWRLIPYQDIRHSFRRGRD